MTRPFIGFLAIVVAGAAPRAEVRVVERGHQLTVAVAPVDGAIWSPAQRSDPDELLNPEGDVFGDGMPSSATNATRLVVAWSRAATPSVLVAQFTPQGQLDLAIPTVDPAAFVRVMPWGTGFLLTWHELADWQIKAVFLDAEGSPGDVTTVGTGVVRGAVPGEGRLLLLIEDPADGVIDLRLLIHIPTPIPVPIQHVSLGRFSVMPEDADIHASRLSRPDRDFVACGAWIASDEAVIAWRAGSGLIGRVRVMGEFATGPDYLPGPQGSCQALIKAAMR